MVAPPFRRIALVIAVAATGLVALATAPLSAQSSLVPDAPGLWKPWKGLTAVASARTEAGVTAVQVKAFEAELRALQAIAARAPGVATPVGFSVETWGYLNTSRPPAHAPGHPGMRRLPMSGGFTFGAFPIFEYVRNGKTIREDTGETALQAFMINDITRGVFDQRHIGDFGGVDHDAFVQPAPGEPIAGLPRYGDTLVIAPHLESPWAPLSLGAALDVVILQRRTEVASFSESVDRFTASLARVRDPERRAARLKDARAAAASMADPEAFVRSVEAALATEEASIAAELGPSGGTGKGLAAAQRALDEVTSWLAELTPSERGAPSCWVENGPTVRARFRAAPSSGCLPLVRPNYAYFNPALPRSVPQVIVITGVHRCFDTADRHNVDANKPGPHGCAANRRLVETIDTDALRAWVK